MTKPNGTQSALSATDNVGTCSFSLVIICPDHVTSQTVSAPNTSGDSWSTMLSGFMHGNWSWHVEVIERDVERS